MRVLPSAKHLAMVPAALAVVVLIAITTLPVPVAGQGAAGLPPEIVSYADTIFTNGKVLTIDKDFSIREALAIRDGKVLATGTNAAILRMAGPQTKKYDLGGRSLIPGIVDTHWHPWNQAVVRRAKDIAAREPKLADFSNVASVKGSSIAELLQNLKAVADSRKPGTWIHALIDSPELGPPFWDKIRRRDLDAVVPNNPLYVDVPVPPLSGGTIINTKTIDLIKAFYGHIAKEEAELDETGNMNGRIGAVFAESILADLIIEHPMETFYPIFREENLRLAALGVTTVSARLLGLWYQPVFREMDRRHEMPIRVAYSVVGTTAFPYAGDLYKRLGDITDMGTDMFWMAGVGVVAIDYAPCSTIKATSLVVDNCMISNPEDVKYKAIYEAVKYGNRIINTHVAGDKAADQLMDLIEAASKDGGLTAEQVKAKGHSMDHCRLNPRPDQIERGKKLGIIWACGAHVLNDAAGMSVVFDEEAVQRWTLPVGSIIRAGARLAGHGEGVSGDSYFVYLERLLTRKDTQGKVWNSNEAIDRKDILRMYTTGSADYVARLDRLGSLESGKFADLVVLDKDYMTIPAGEFHTLHPILTVVGGKVVFQKEDDPWASSIR